jgi:hypothetical protein
MAKVDEITELSEDVGQPIDKDLDKDDPRPHRDHAEIDPDKPAGTTDPRP